MKKLAELMVQAGKEKAKARSAEQSGLMPSSMPARYVNIKEAVNGFTIRFNCNGEWDSKVAVAKDAKEIAEAIEEYFS